MSEEYQNARVKITYDFDFYEDGGSLKDLVNHREAYIDLHDIYNEARSMLKHGDLSDVDEVERVLESIKELAWRE